MIYSVARGEDLCIKIRPAISLISVFSSRDPSVLFLKSRSASPRHEALFIKLRPTPSLISDISLPAPPF
jgi:hypothetical protein